MMSLRQTKDLGASDAIILFKIIIPLTLSGIISGIIMVFVPALTSFVISDLLGGGKVLLIGNVIEQEFMQGNQLNLGLRSFRCVNDFCHRKHGSHEYFR